MILPLIFWFLTATIDRGAGLTRIDPSHTCMGSNQAKKSPQSFAEVEGKRYYGCSKMCIVSLKESPKFRYSIDPVSGKKVDKAKALVAAKPGGGLIYFESEETFLIFQSQDVNFDTI